MSTPTREELRAAVELACQPTYVPRIQAGRSAVLALPREWVLTHIESVAFECINFDDYWEYRRLLELAEQLSPELVQRLLPIGLASTDPDVREAADDFIQR